MVSQAKTVLLVVATGDYTGASRMVHQYARAFRQRNWRVAVIVGDRPPPPAESLADRLLQQGFEVGEERGFAALLSVGLIWRIVRRARVLRPDLMISAVQADLKIVGPAARLLGLPHIVFDQTTHNFYGPRFLQSLKERVFRREMQRATGIVSTSPAVRDEAVNRFHVEGSRIIVVENGIDTTGYGGEVAAAPGLPGRHPDRFRILNIGRLDPQKGQAFLLQALAQCRKDGVDCEVILAGAPTHLSSESEDYAAQLRSAAADGQIADRVHFIGWRTDVPALCQACDAYVHSALWEGPPLPLAVLEAMASGLPVVITDCAGWPVGFQQKVHGMVVPASNAAALAEAIAWLVRLPAAERLQIGRNAQRLIRERFEIAVTGDRFVDACEQLLERFAPGTTPTNT
jgi:glycosyltransferase involved in cell wall biosynthesis